MAENATRLARLAILDGAVLVANRFERRGQEAEAITIRGEARKLARRWSIEISEIDGLARI